MLICALTLVFVSNASLESNSFQELDPFVFWLTFGMTVQSTPNFLIEAKNEMSEEFYSNLEYNHSLDVMKYLSSAGAEADIQAYLNIVGTLDENTNYWAYQVDPYLRGIQVQALEALVQMSVAVRLNAGLDTWDTNLKYTRQEWRRLLRKSIYEVRSNKHSMIESAENLQIEFRQHTQNLWHEMQSTWQGASSKKKDGVQIYSQTYCHWG